MAKVSEDVYNDAKTAITGLKATSTGKEVAAAREHFDKIKDYLSKSDRTNLENAFKAFDGTDTTAGSAAGKQGSDIAGKFPKLICL